MITHTITQNELIDICQRGKSREVALRPGVHKATREYLCPSGKSA